jgi:sulfotransferase
MQKIFYQSSLPRSGSTLLQNVMGQNPDFYVTPTSGVLELVYAARSNFSNSPEFKAQDSELMKAAFMNFCNKGMQGFFSAITEKPYIIDKSRGWGVHYNFLDSFNKDPKIICMIRDPRDIFTSMEKNFRKNQHLDTGIVNHAQMTGTTTEKRIDMWTNSQPIGLAFERLYQIIKEKNDEKILFVKYEDLCSNPTEQMKRIYDYLEVPFYAHDFNNIEQITQEDDNVYGIYGDHSIRQQLSLTKSTANDVLGVDACKWIKNTFKWYFEKFKYY